MAAPTTYKFGKMLVYLEDRVTPNTYIAPCGFAEKTFEISKELSDTTIPDCDDPDAPAWTGREVRALSWSVSGSGVLAKEAFEEWRTFAQSSGSRKVRVLIAQDTTAPYTAGDGGYWTGPAHLESFQITANLGEKVQIAVTLQGDGETVWTAN